METVLLSYPKKDEKAIPKTSETNRSRTINCSEAPNDSKGSNSAKVPNS